MKQSIINKYDDGSLIETTIISDTDDRCISKPLSISQTTQHINEKRSLQHLDEIQRQVRELLVHSSS